MNTYASAYKQKLTTPQKAVGKIKDGSTIIHGMGAAEPPALLAAIAQRAREGDLKDIKVFTLFPMEHVTKTVLAPELSDCIQAYSWFMSSAERGLVKVGLNYFVPNYYHQVPRLIRDFMEMMSPSLPFLPWTKRATSALALSTTLSPQPPGIARCLS